MYLRRIIIDSHLVLDQEHSSTWDCDRQTDIELCVLVSGLFIPRPPGSFTTRSTYNYVPIGRRNVTEEKDEQRRMKKHMAGRYNFKAKWEKLLAEKEARWVGF